MIFWLQVRRSTTELNSLLAAVARKILRSFAKHLAREYREKTTPLWIFMPCNLSPCRVEHVTWVRNAWDFCPLFRQFHICSYIEHQIAAFPYLLHFPIPGLASLTLHITRCIDFLWGYESWCANTSISSNPYQDSGIVWNELIECGLSQCGPMPHSWPVQFIYNTYLFWWER